MELFSLTDSMQIGVKSNIASLVTGVLLKLLHLLPPVSAAASCTIPVCVCMCGCVCALCVCTCLSKRVRKDRYICVHVCLYLHVCFIF